MAGIKRTGEQKSKAASELWWIIHAHMGARVLYFMYSGLPQIFNLWEEEEVRQAKLACEFHLASHFRRDARVILYGHLCFFLSRFPTLQSPLTPFAWGR